MLGPLSPIGGMCTLMWMHLLVPHGSPISCVFSSLLASSPSATTPLQEPVFQQFLHDVHHAYLLLHRAMSLLPPTMIPNIEPMPLPSTGVWDQPEGFLPQQEYSNETNNFIDSVQLPPPDLSEEELLMQDFIHHNLPQPRHHLAAPVPDSVPAPPKLSPSTSTLPATPKKRTAKAVPKVPAKRRKLRSASPKISPSSPPIWTNEDKKLLRNLKTDEKARYGWKGIAGKLGKPEPDANDHVEPH